MNYKQNAREIIKGLTLHMADLDVIPGTPSGLTRSDS